MRFALAALALAATAFFPVAYGHADMVGQPASTAMPAAAQPETAAPAADDTPPPFMQRHKVKRQPVQADLTFAQRPAPEEFRGLPFGLSLETAQARFGLKPVTQPVALPDTYMRAGELLKLGPADIRTVAYYFRKGTFRGVGIAFEGDANFFLIKDHLIGMYGPGRQIGGRYGWTWPHFNIDLRLDEGRGELRYTYEP